MLGSVSRFAGYFLAATLLVSGCERGEPTISSGGFRDDFNRADLGPAWKNTGGPYEIRNGELHIQGAHNKPLWLKRRLPHDVVIDFDVRSMTPDGDIKVEVFGDGQSKAETVSYTATSYVVIFGGWSNQLNIIARMNEHANDRAVGPRNPVKIGHTYHMRIERRGNMIRSFADDVMLAEMNDPNPMFGEGHDHFGINNWQSDLWFDNLRITPL